MSEGFVRYGSELEPAVRQVPAARVLALARR